MQDKPDESSMQDAAQPGAAADARAAELIPARDMSRKEWRLYSTYVVQ
jgi:hypothetical protein